MILALSAGIAVAAQTPAVDLASTRQALGGDAMLDAVTSFVITGTRTRTIAGFMSSESIEISAILPDRFLQVTRQMSQTPRGSFTITRYEGFNGDEAILDTVAPGTPFPVVIPGPQPTTPDEIAAAQRRRLNANKHLFVRVTWPLFAASFSSYPLVMSPAGQTALQSGPATITEAKGPDAFTWRLFVDASTHLPTKLTWMDKPLVTATTTSIVKVGPRGEIPPPDRMPNLPSRDPTAGLASVEWETTLSDYRVDNGLNWPRRWTTTMAGQRHEEVRINRIRINPEINPNTFAPRKGGGS